MGREGRGEGRGGGVSTVGIITFTFIDQAISH